MEFLLFVLLHVALLFFFISRIADRVQDASSSVRFFELLNASLRHSPLRVKDEEDADSQGPATLVLENDQYVVRHKTITEYAPDGAAYTEATVIVLQQTGKKKRLSEVFRAVLQDGKLHAVSLSGKREQPDKKTEYSVKSLLGEIERAVALRQSLSARIARRK